MQGCGRVLKVPAQFRPATTPAAPDRGIAGYQRLGAGSDAAVGAAQAGVVPFWTRLGLWFVAVPVGFVLVFGFARAFGLLSSQQLQDVFLEEGWDRFWPVARLLPFVALVTASIVHFSVLYISRWRVRHATQQQNAPKVA